VYDKAGFDAVRFQTHRSFTGFVRTFRTWNTSMTAIGDTGGEPSLTEMTAKAIEILSEK